LFYLLINLFVCFQSKPRSSKASKRKSEFDDDDDEQDQDFKEEEEDDEDEEYSKPPSKVQSCNNFLLDLDVTIHFKTHTLRCEGPILQSYTQFLSRPWKSSQH